jgi:long-subunit acyl-CoA synthetase (AMP-forming)
MADARSEIKPLHELFHRSAKHFPENTAVTFSGDVVESVTYRDLGKKVENLSTIFDKIFCRNEVIGIYSRDCLNLSAILLAVMDASAAFYPISTTAKPRKVLESIKDRSLRYILVENGLLPNLLKLDEYDNLLENTDSRFLHDVEFSILKVTNRNLCRNEPCVVNWCKNLAYVMQTSGTTGAPKAVFVPHSCIVPNILHLRWVG